MEVQNMDISISSPYQMATANGFSNHAEIDAIVEYLTDNEHVYFKSQQKDEDELTKDKKREIALNIYNTSKANFLSRFGQFIKPEHLEYFKRHSECADDEYEIDFHLSALNRFHCHEKRQKDIKNRRYEALKKLKSDTTYFSETEMMRRNPLLYEHLVGQYLTEEQRKQRDSVDSENENVSFVSLLLEGIDKENVQELKHKQEDDESEVLEEDEEEDNDSTEPFIDTKFAVPDGMVPPSTSKWGEWDNKADRRKDEIANSVGSVKRERNWFLISDQEKSLLKEEFMSHMYQSFLNGKDADFDYTSVDSNNSYDNIDTRTQDEEEKYFDAETPEEITNNENDKMENGEDSSDDELDVFMRKLNEQPTVSELTTDMEKCNSTLSN